MSDTGMINLQVSSSATTVVLIVDKHSHAVVEMNSFATN